MISFCFDMYSNASAFLTCFGLSLDWLAFVSLVDAFVFSVFDAAISLPPKVVQLRPCALFHLIEELMHTLRPLAYKFPRQKPSSDALDSNIDDGVFAQALCLAANMNEVTHIAL